MFAGQAPIEGACVSFTITVNEQAAVFPEVSVAVQVTVVVPFANAAPEAGLQITAAPEQLSVTVGTV